MNPALIRKLLIAALSPVLVAATCALADAWEVIIINGQPYLFEPIDTPTPSATTVIRVSGINNNAVMVGTFRDSVNQTFGFVRGPGIPFKEEPRCGDRHPALQFTSPKGGLPWLI